MRWSPQWKANVNAILDRVRGMDLLPPPPPKPMFHEVYPMQDKTIVMGPAPDGKNFQASFPYALSDLSYFVVKRKDGLMVRYNILNPGDEKKTQIVVGSKFGGGGNATTYFPKKIDKQETFYLSKWCTHHPAEEPLFYNNGLDIYIADVIGFRAHYKEFDTAIDCGAILSASQVYNPNDHIFSGDGKLVEKFEPFIITPNENDPKILVIDWDDRKAPKLKPSFWPMLVKTLKGTALIACQGGHGRSGTGAVCMMMALNPEYTPADAIIHLRAVHCARAIESKEQHEYIGMVGEYLGRVNDIARIPEIKDFKAEFLKSTHKSSLEYQQRLLMAGEVKK